MLIETTVVFLLFFFFRTRSSKKIADFMYFIRNMAFLLKGAYKKFH